MFSWIIHHFLHQASRLCLFLGLRRRNQTEIWHSWLLFSTDGLTIQYRRLNLLYSLLELSFCKSQKVERGIARLARLAKSRKQWKSYVVLDSKWLMVDFWASRSGYHLDSIQDYQSTLLMSRRIQSCLDKP